MGGVLNAECEFVQKEKTKDEDNSEGGKEEEEPCLSTGPRVPAGLQPFVGFPYDGSGGSK